MTRSSVHLTHRFRTLLHPLQAAGIALCLAFLISLVSSAVWAQSPAVSSNSSESEAAKAYRSGMSLVKAGRLDEAITTLENGLRADPRNTTLLNMIGATYTLKGDFGHAETYLIKCLQTDRGFVPAQKNLAINYFNSGKYDSAFTEFKKLKDMPGDSRSVAFLFLGIIAEKQGNFAQSVSLLGESGDVVYQYPEAILSLGRSLLELDQPQKADNVLQRLDAMSGMTAAEYFKAGHLYSQRRQYHQALADFERADKVDPGLAGLQYQRAVVLDQLGRSDEALKLLKNLASIKPDADALNLLSDLAKRAGDLNLAIQSLRQAALLAPEKEVNYLDFSTLCMDYENYPLALHAADVGLAHIPDSYRLQVQKGAILDKLGRFGEAEKIVQRASKLQQDNSVALLSLAIIQTHAGELQDAINTLSAAIKKFPSNSQMHYYLGVAFEQTLHHDARAAEAFRAAIRLNPSFADSYYHVAKVYLKKDPKLAEQNFLTCLRLDPHHLSAEYSLGRLYLKTGRRAKGQALIDAFKRQQEAEKLKAQQKPSLELAQR
jgi:tetratricopeptide (TPR) repeat protein